MATPKKTTSTKKAVEVKSVADMLKQLAEMQQDLMTSRRSHRAGELVNPRVLSTLRKDIARLMTAIRAAEISADKESK
ncbi:MAG: 50S ribosomal protein L29 [Candidatus Saccharimonas sp.]|nr:50S ribosomal protein L29 [Candidatus Saccharimonas sp.]